MTGEAQSNKPDIDIIPVYTSVLVRKISDIDVVNQSFAVELDYALKWHASKDDYNKYRYNLMFPKFKPKLSFVNAKCLSMKYTSTKNSYYEIKDDQLKRYGCIEEENVENSHWITHNFTISAIFYKEFANLVNFPFDAYQLSVELELNATPSTWDESVPVSQFKFFNLTPEGPEAGLRVVSRRNAANKYRESGIGNNYANKLYLNTAWLLDDITIDFSQNLKPITNCTAILLLNGFARNHGNAAVIPPSDLILEINKFLGDINSVVIHPPDSISTCMQINFEIYRYYSYYLYRFMFILFMLTSIAMLSGLFLENTGQQFLFYLILILAIIAIQFHVSSPLQTVYYTFYDKYAIASIVFIVMHLLVVTFVVNDNDCLDSDNNINNRNKNTYDNVRPLLFLIIIFIFYNFLFIIYGLTLLSKPKTKTKQSISNRGYNYKLN